MRYSYHTETTDEDRVMDIKIGDYISFKCDIEQSAKVVRVVRDKDYLGRPEVSYIVEAPLDGFSGHYIGRDDFHTVSHRDVWVE